MDIDIWVMDIHNWIMGSMNCAIAYIDIIASLSDIHP